MKTGKVNFMNDDGIVLGVLAFLSAMIAIITPIIKLNSNIVELTTTLKALEETYKVNHKKLENKVADHEKQIDELEKVAVTHDLRIKNIEQRSDTK